MTAIIRLSFLAALLPFFLPVAAQRAEIDQLQKKLAEAPDDSTRWYCALQLSASYLRISFDSSKLYGEQSLALSQNFGKGSCKARSMNTLGATYWAKGDHETALKYYFESLKISEPGGFDQLASTTLGNIGMLYSERNDPDRSLEYLRRAMAIKRSIRDTLGLVRTMSNIGRTFFNNTGQLDSALVYFQLCLPLFDALPDQIFGKGIVLNNLGAIFLSKEDYPRARDYFYQSLQIREKLGDKGGQSVVLGNLGELALAEGNFTQSIDYYERSLALSRETGSETDQGDIWEKLSKAYAAQKNFPKAYECLLKYSVWQDTLHRRERAASIANMEVKYQTQQKEAELARQQLAFQQQTNEKRLILGSALFLILALFGLFQYFRNRQKIKQKEAELALQLEHAEAEKLRELDEVKSSFFANISHEFRTPLTLIAGPVKKWLSQNGSADTLSVPTREATVLQRNADRLLELVNQLLDLSKLESGRMKLSVAHDDLSQTLRVLAHTFDSMAEHNGMAYRIEVPETTEMAWFDRDKIGKIITNLLSNAFKHTPPGGTVAFAAHIETGRLICNITDTGSGIPTHDLEKIFDRFYQVEGTGDKGTGIGLALVKELVALHRGHISVQSKPGEGTAFTVELPVGEAAFNTDEKVETSQTDAISKPAPTGEAVTAVTAIPGQLPLCLIVEDNRDVQDFIREQLEQTFRILLAKNGRDGLQTATEQIPDLVVSDVMMPEMDGNQLCAALKTDERTSHIPVILLTAKADQASRISGLETGADDYLTKPFDSRELLVRAQNLVSQREKLRKQFSRTVVLKPQEIALTSADERFLQRIQESLDANLGNEQFSVEELASAVGMSRSQLHRKLTALIDQPPVEFIRNFRLRRAKEMLEAGTGNVSEIGFEVGFSSPAYFSKVFKDAFGVSPGEVRSGK